MRKSGNRLFANNYALALNAAKCGEPSREQDLHYQSALAVSPVSSSLHPLFGNRFAFMPQPCLLGIGCQGQIFAERRGIDNFHGGFEIGIKQRDNNRLAIVLVLIDYWFRYARSCRERERGCDRYGCRTAQRTATIIAESGGKLDILVNNADIFPPVPRLPPITARPRAQ